MSHGNAVCCLVQCTVRLHVITVMCTVGFPESPKPKSESARVRERERHVFSDLV